MKKKQERNKIEEGSIENMEQFAFRGLKQRGMIEERVII